MMNDNNIKKPPPAARGDLGVGLRMQICGEKAIKQNLLQCGSLNLKQFCKKYMLNFGLFFNALLGYVKKMANF